MQFPLNTKPDFMHVKRCSNGLKIQYQMYNAFTQLSLIHSTCNMNIIQYTCYNNSFFKHYLFHSYRTQYHEALSRYPIFYPISISHLFSESIRDISQTFHNHFIFTYSMHNNNPHNIINLTFHIFT